MTENEKEHVVNDLDMSTSTLSNSSSSASSTSIMGESLWHSGSMKNKRSQDIFWETQASPPIGRYEVLEHDPRTNWNIKSFNKKPAVRQPRKRMSKAERVERMERSWRGGTLKNKKTNEIPFNASGPSPGAYNVLEADPRNNWSLKSFNIYRQ